MEKDHIDEIKREEAQIQQEEGMMQWIEDNKQELIAAYLDDNESDFDEYCRDGAREWYRHNKGWD